MAIADGSFFMNPVFLDAIDHAKKNNSKLHLMGLLGAGGVHSNIEHLFALIQLAAKQNFRNLFIHVFTDGRDSPPNASKTYVHRLKEILQKEGVGEIASIMGRYYAMDRDLRWERTAKAYFALTRGQANFAQSVEDVINNSYAKNISDEFIEPTLICDQNNKPKALIGQNDAVIFFNFRIDRPRQLSRTFVVKDLVSASTKWSFDPYAVKYGKKHLPNSPSARPLFDRGAVINNLYFGTMTEYEKILVDEGAHAAFPPEVITMPLGRVISTESLRQLRASESEKERFVTFYFNGQREVIFENEEHLIVPSPKVATYDLKPEMSAYELTNQLIEKMNNGDYAFVLVNYANPDMVGHTGNIQAGIKAVEAVDQCIDKLASFVLSYGGALIITADHGNVEEMISPHTGKMNTEHSANPVPFIIISKDLVGNSGSLNSGILADIAPTVLWLLGLEVPTTMTGRNLLADLGKF
jgi:2,3-bisphosphoglycerate-independent phosphoglycerate mutase